MAEGSSNAEIREVIQTKNEREFEFPEDPEKRFEAVFSAIGNSEAKCVTLLCLSKSPLTGGQLYREFLNNTRKVWKVHHGNPAATCEQTLVPSGLVAQTATLNDGEDESVANFRLTDAGEKYGQPVAAFLLQESAHFQESFLKIFGATSKGSGNTRPVINRVNILEILASDNNTLRKTDIVERKGINPASTLEHLQSLVDAGLIQYKSASTETKGYAVYKLTEQADPTVVQPESRYPSLSREVTRLIFDLKSVDVNSLTESLKEKYPGSSFRSLQGNISIVLSEMIRKKIIKAELFIGGDVLSQARITEFGRSLVSEVLTPIRLALAGDEHLLAQWRSIPWQDYAPTTVSKYKESSGYGNRKSSKYWANEALGIIQDNPGIRPKELQKRIKGNVSVAIKFLVVNGKVRRETGSRGRTARYYVS